MPLDSGANLRSLAAQQRDGQTKVGKIFHRTVLQIWHQRRMSRSNPPDAAGLRSNHGRIVVTHDTFFRFRLSNSPASVRHGFACSLGCGISSAAHHQPGGVKPMRFSMIMRSQYPQGHEDSKKVIFENLD